MARRPKIWMYAGARADNKPSPAKKDAITLACDRVIQDVLIPRFLPEIRPHTDFNYPIGIHGKWLGNEYRFMTRYKSDSPNRIAEGFDAPFARLEYVSPDCFDLSWHRHTGTYSEECAAPTHRGGDVRAVLRIAGSGSTDLRMGREGVIPRRPTGPDRLFNP
jgi:hypothetical protein